MRIAVKVIAAILLVIFAAATVLFSSAKKKAELQLQRSEQVAEDIEKELNRVKEDEESAKAKHKECLDDLVSSLDTNNQLREEAGKLKVDIEKLKNLVVEQDMIIQQLKSEQGRGTAKLLSQPMPSASGKVLLEEIQDLRRQKEELEFALQNERALFHYNLGVVYMKAELYPAAIAEYEKSLEFNPDEADTHYNLGFLYERINKDPVRAAYHYRRYLELNPDADDAVTVQGLIHQLFGSHTEPLSQSQ